MPQITITIDEQQEAKILAAIATNHDFIIDGGTLDNGQKVKRITFALEKCPTCKGSRCSRVLGGGGDYEDWPCPACRPAEYQECVRQTYSCGAHDGNDAD